MKYEVREILKKKKLTAWGVFNTDAAKGSVPIHVFGVDDNPNGEIVAHHLALQMAHDLEAGIE